MSRRGTSIPPLTAAAILRGYQEEGRTITELEELHGLARTTIRNFLRERGVTLRSNAEKRAERSPRTDSKPRSITHIVRSRTDVEVLRGHEVITVLSILGTPEMALDEAERHVRHMASFGTTAWPRAAYRLRTVDYRQEERAVVCWPEVAA